MGELIELRQNANDDAGAQEGSYQRNLWEGVLPYAVLRYGGVTPRIIDKLACPQTVQMIDTLIELECSCRRSAEFLCMELGDLIAKQYDSLPVREILSIRRDIFNGRLPNAIGILENGILPRSVEGHLRKWLDAKNALAITEQIARKELIRENASATRHLKYAFRHNEFRRAISFTNPILSRELTKYVTEDCTQQRTKKVRHTEHKLRQTEHKLLKYYLRAGFRVSPFSSFARSRVAVLSSVDSTFSQVTRSANIRRSVKINRALVNMIARYLASSPECRDCFPVRPNYTYIDVQGGRVYLSRRYTRIASSRVPVPEDVLVRLPLHPFIAIVHSVLEENSDAGFGSKATTLLNQLDARTAEIFEALLGLGIFSQELVIGSDEDGLAVLIAALRQNHAPTARAVLDCLVSLESVVAQIGTARPSEREQLVVRAEVMASEACKRAGLLEANWHGSTLFEDCVEGPVRFGLIDTGGKDVVQDLRRCISMFGEVLDANASIRLTLKAIIKNYFHGKPTPFLTLLHCFKANCIDANATKVHEFDHTPNWLDVPALRELGRCRCELGSWIGEVSEEEERDIGLDPRCEELRREMAKLGVWSRKDKMWFSCYLQSWQNSDTGPTALLNRIIDGPYRCLARVCGMMADDHERNVLVHEISQTLASAWRSGLPTEMRENFDYNANLHPAFTALSLRSDASPSDVNSINWADLVVRLDEADELCISTRDGRVIIPLDLGMLDPSFEPIKQKLLVSILRAMPLSTRPFFTLDWFPSKQARGIQHYPRLRFGSCVVRPRGWAIERAQLPQRASKMGDYDYFAEVRRWQSNVGVPDEVFLSLAISAEHIAGVGTSKHAWSLRTPIYINFTSYRLVDIFERVIREATTLAYLEEVAPQYRAQPGPRIRVKELVLDIAASSLSGGARIYETTTPSA